jgi:hypothetical protein
MRQVFGKNSARIFKNLQSHLGRIVAAAGASVPAGFGGCAAVTAFRAPIYLGSPEKGKSKKEFLIFFGVSWWSSSTGKNRLLPMAANASRPDLTKYKNIRILVYR